MKKKLTVLILISLTLLIYGESENLQVDKKESKVEIKDKSIFFDISKIEEYIINNYPNDYMRYKIIETQVKEDVKEISFGVFKNSNEKEIFLVKLTPKSNKIENIKMYVLLFFDSKSEYLQLKDRYLQLIDEELEISSIYVKVDESGDYFFTTNKEIFESNNHLEKEMIKIKFNNIKDKGNNKDMNEMKKSEEEN
ncbi:MAG: hypothetical protein ACQERZ_09150 [Fusobacteriota bacterium]